jgi:hypothetical protein
MPRPSPRPAPPVEPLTAECAAQYWRDDIHARAFVFTLPHAVPGLSSRFTLYAPNAIRYTVGASYVLTLTEAGTTPPASTVQEGTRP